jgi:uncharacterized delta-60 repeat protein
MTPKSGFYKALAVAVQPDNKVVVVGYGFYSSKQDVPIVARYNENGSPDSTFGSGGRVFILNVANSKSSGLAAAVTLQWDGKILVTGQYGWVLARRLFVCRLNSSGLLDTTFNGTGQNLLSDVIGDGSGVATQWIGQEEHTVVAGTIRDGIYEKAAVLRLKSNGQLDSSFSSSGIVLMDVTPQADYGHAIAIDSENRLVVLGSGQSENDPVGVWLTRFDAFGVLDTAFGSSGIVLLPISQRGGIGYGIAIQADHKILVSGNTWRIFDPTRYLVVWRFDANGAADPSFGSNGWVTTDFEASFYGGRTAVQSDGKFVVAGSANGKAALARFWNLPPQ